MRIVAQTQLTQNVLSICLYAKMHKNIWFKIWKHKANIKFSKNCSLGLFISNQYKLSYYYEQETAEKWLSLPASITKRTSQKKERTCSHNNATSKWFSLISQRPQWYRHKSYQNSVYHKIQPGNSPRCGSANGLGSSTVRQGSHPP